MSELIYYLQAGDGIDAPVRIDTCTHIRLAMRVGQLQAGNPEPLLIRALYAGGHAELARVRARHAAERIHDAWHTAHVLEQLPDDLEAVAFDEQNERRKLARRTLGQLIRQGAS